MSKGFHISPKTGRSGVCNPEKTGICQFAEDGVEPPHYETKEAAEAVIQETLKAEFGNINPITKKPFSKSYLAKRERDRRDKKTISELQKHTERELKRREAEKEFRKNGRAPHSEFSIQEELKREDGIIYFKNGMTSQYVYYAKQEYVKKDAALSVAIAEYAAARGTLSDFDKIAELRKKVIEKINDLPESKKSLASFRIMDKSDQLLTQYALSSLAISNDYTHGYPVGTTTLLEKARSRKINYPETNDVKEIKELDCNDRLIEPMVENLGRSTSINDFNNNNNEYERFINGPYLLRLKAEVSPEVLKAYQDRKENEVYEVKLKTLTRMKDSIKTPFLASRKTKEQNAIKIAEIDAMIADL